MNWSINYDSWKAQKLGVQRANIVCSLTRGYKTQWAHIEGPSHISFKNFKCAMGVAVNL